MNAGDRTGGGDREAARLVALIAEQAEREAEQVVSDARDRVGEIGATAEREVDRIRAGARAQGEASGRRRAAQLVAAAEAETRRAWLHARESIIAGVIDAAREQISQTPATPRAIAGLLHLLEEGLAVLPDGRLCVRGHASHAGLLKRAIHASGHGERLDFVADENCALGGVIVETDDGRLRYDNSFDARVRRQRDRLRRLIADALLVMPALPAGNTGSE